jgi:Putative addiction module component.
MATTIDKEQLIEAIRETNDERILFAISRLLQVDDDIPEWHKDIVQQRLKDIEEGKAVFHNWNDIKDDLFKSK